MSNEGKPLKEADLPTSTLLFGDCRVELGGVAADSVDLIVTSPPYANQRASTYGGVKPDDYVAWFLPIADELQRVLKPSGTFILNIKECAVKGERHTYVLELILALRQRGWLWTEEFVWHKKNCYPGKWPNRFRDSWERLLQFNKQRKFKMNQEAVMVPVGDWYMRRMHNLSATDRQRDESKVGSGFGKKVENWLGRDKVYPTNVLHRATECANRSHSAAFPHWLPEWFIDLFTDPGDVVLDPFIGSGATAFAALDKGRHVIGIELHEPYYEELQKKLNQNKERIMLPIVDTHQHLWDLAQFALPWLEDPAMEPLRKNHLMSDYLAAAEGTGMARTVYMEVDVAAEQRVAEAEFVASLCKADDNPMAGAVIGGRPGTEGFRAYIARFKGHDCIKGVRQVLHGPDAESGRCLQERFVRDVQYLGEVGLSFDLCLRPSELGDAVGLVDQCPDTRFIVDHCGNADPQIVNGAAEHDPANPFSHTKEQWQRDMAALAERERVVCKISGIIARASAGWSADALAPTVEHCLDCFGPDRVVFGGDWPVCNFGASLGAWVAALRAIVAERPEEEQAKLFAGNAERLYGLE